MVEDVSALSGGAVDAVVANAGVWPCRCPADRRRQLLRRARHPRRACGRCSLGRAAPRAVADQLDGERSCRTTSCWSTLRSPGDEAKAMARAHELADAGLGRAPIYASTQGCAEPVDASDRAGAGMGRRGHPAQRHRPGDRRDADDRRPARDRRSSVPRWRTWCRCRCTGTCRPRCPPVCSRGWSARRTPTCAASSSSSTAGPDAAHSRRQHLVSGGPARGAARDGSARRSCHRPTGAEVHPETDSPRPRRPAWCRRRPAVVSPASPRRRAAPARTAPS